MGYATAQLSALHLTTSQGADQTTLNTFMRARAQELRTLLENAEWVRVSGAAEMPPLAEIDTVVANVHTGVSTAAQTLLTDYYKLNVGTGETELFVGVQHWSIAQRTSSSNGKYFLAARMIAGWSITTSGIDFPQTISNTFYNSGANSSNTVGDMPGAGSTHTIEAWSTPGSLALSYGGIGNSYCMNENLSVVERWRDSSGLMRHGDEAGIGWYNIGAQSSQTSAPVGTYGVQRKVDRAARQTSAGSSFGGSGPWQAPYFPAPLNGTTPVSGLYDGDKVPVYPPLYWDQGLRYGQHVLALPGADAPAPGVTLTAPRPTGGGSGNYDVPSISSRFDFGNNALRLAIERI
jgi:hypothetical protein